jgi:hypothetical protein
VLPLVVAAPLLGLLLNMSRSASQRTTLTLLAGTPAIAFIGAAGASVAVALPRGGCWSRCLCCRWHPGADLRRVGQLCRYERPGARSCRPSCCCAQ